MINNTHPIILQVLALMRLYTKVWCLVWCLVLHASSYILLSVHTVSLGTNITDRLAPLNRIVNMNIQCIQSAQLNLSSL